MGNLQQPRETTFHLTELGLVGEDIYQVRLEWPRGESIPFQPGQYLALHLPERDPAWFSIACAPGAQQLTLHVQAPPEWESAREVIDYLKKHGSVRVSLPYGEACLRDVPDEPLLLVVAGTGFAQAKSIVDYLRHCGTRQPVYLYWGVREPDELYLRALAEQWSEEWEQFHFQPVVCADSDDGTDCHHDRLVEAILQDSHDLERIQVLASGSPAMVYSVLDGLVEQGLSADQFKSDVLQYAPRD